MRPEAKVLKDVLKFLDGLKKAGEKIWWVKVAGGPRQRRGLPDLHITLRGISIWIELKAPGEVPTPLQDSILRKIAAAGGIMGFATSVEEVQQILKTVLKGETTS